MKAWRYSVLIFLLVSVLLEGVMLLFLLSREHASSSTSSVLTRAAASLEDKGFYYEAAELYVRAYWNGERNAELLLKAGELYFRDGQGRDSVKVLEVLRAGGERSLEKKANEILMACLEAEGKSAQAQYFLDRTTSPRNKGVEKDRVVAEVGSRKIYASEVREALNDVPPEERKEIEKRIDEFARQFVARQVVVMLAKRAGLDKDPQVSRRMREASQQILVQAFLEKKLREMKPGEEDLQNYYLAHKDEFVRYRKVKVKYLRAETPSDVSVLKYAAKGDFEGIYRSAGKGMAGETAVVNGKIPPQISCGPNVIPALYRANENDVVGPFVCGSQTYLFKVVAKSGKEIPDFDEVRVQVLAAYTARRVNEFLSDLLEKEVREGRVKYFGMGR